MAMAGDFIFELPSKVRAMSRILFDRGEIARPTQRCLAEFCNINLSTLKSCLRSDSHRMSSRLQSRIAETIGFDIYDPTWIDRDLRGIATIDSARPRKDTAEAFESMLRHLSAENNEALTALPDQSYGVQFHISDSGLIDFASDTAQSSEYDTEKMRVLQSSLIAACDRFSELLRDGSGHNAFGHLINDVTIYREAISGQLRELEFYRVWTLGVGLQKTRDATARDVDRLAPSMEDDQQAALDTILGLHGPFVLSTKQGRELQSLANMQAATQTDLEEFREVAQEFRIAVRETTDLVADGVKDLIDQVNDNIGTGAFSEREVVAAKTTNRNLVIAIGSVAAFVGVSAGAGIIENAAAASEIGNDLIRIGKQAIDKVELLGRSAIRFLLDHRMTLMGLAAASAEGFPWLDPIITTLRHRQDKKPEPKEMFNGDDKESIERDPVQQTTYPIIRVERDTSLAGLPPFEIGVVRVSVGFSHFEGDRLAAITRWMCSSGFEKQMYLVGDTLQRYRLIGLEGYGREDAYEESLRLGGDWINRNSPLIKSVTESSNSKVEVTRWNDWIEHPDYTKYRDDALMLFQNNIGFQQAIDEDIRRFAKNKPNIDALLTDTGFFESSKSFLLEEISVHELVLATYGGVQIYPGSQLKSQAYIQAMSDPSLFPMLQTKYFVGLSLNRLKKVA